MFLLLKPKIGLWMTFFIITIDVLHNGIFALSFNKKNLIDIFINSDWMKHNWMFACQVILAFLFYRHFGII